MHGLCFVSASPRFAQTYLDTIRTRESETLLGQRVNVGRVNLSSVAANVREAQVVCQADEEVWSLAHGCNGLILFLKPV
jgi:hypothetical protein